MLTFYISNSDSPSNLNVKQNGFTFLEMVIVVGVILMGLTVIFNVAINNLLASESAQNTFLAATLAQEGYEIVRNFRDTNWLINDDTTKWRIQDPLKPGTVSLVDGNYRADYNDLSLNLAINDCGTSLTNEPFLKIDANGFYNYESGSDTKFKRVMCISTPQSNQMKVTVKVAWEERGEIKSLTLENLLYNWK